MRLPGKDDPLVIKGSFFIALIALALWLKFLTVDINVAAVLNWPFFDMPLPDTLRFFMRALAVSPASLGAILCLLLPASFFPPKRRAAALITIAFLVTILVVTDRIFMRYYSDIFIFHDIVLAPQAGQLTRSIRHLLKISDLLLFSDILIWTWLLASGRLRVVWLNGRKIRIVILAVILISAAVQFASVHHLKACRPNIIDAMYDRLSVCAWISTGTFHWCDFLSICKNALTPRTVPAETAAEISGWFSDHRSKPHRGTKAKNVILIQCEALQYFVTDLEIDGVTVTPNLNRFKNECVYFPNTWSQVAAGNSSDAEFMANTGLFPAAYGAAYTRYADNYYNSLARAMRKKYNARTFVVQGTKSSFWNCHRMHPTLGFHRQYSQNTYPKEEVIGLGLSDGVIFSKAAEIIEAAGTPFYAFIVTLSCHHPYDFEGIPKDDLILPPEMEGTLTGNYLRSVNYFDREFGAFIEKLRSSGVLDKSLVVVYGDHPAIPIAAKEEMEKLFGLYLENNTNWKKTRRIPLLFRTPESAKHPRTDYRNVGQMDILPTVSGLMRLGIDTAFGADLFAGSKDDLVIFRNGSYISGDVLVDPASNRAVDIRDCEQTDAAAYDADTAEAERRLRYNDLVLENNLLKKIMPKQ